MTEQGSQHPHSPQEYHPPVEEYLETMLGLAEEGVPVIQARIAERLGGPRPRCPRCSTASSTTATSPATAAACR